MMPHESNMNRAHENPPLDYEPRFRCGRSAFTLLESLVALVLCALAAAALTMGMTTSIQTTEYGLQQEIATGIAEQLADEIVGKLYYPSGGDPYSSYLGPEAYEAAVPRAGYDDADDFDDFTATPPESPLEVTLGEDDGQGAQRHPNFRLTPSHFEDWREEVDVYFVSESDPSVRLAGSDTSGLRAVEVSIYYDDGVSEKKLTSVRRLIGYVPAP